MNNLVVFSISFFLSSYAWSSAITFNKLMDEVNNGSVFKQITSSISCPNHIKLKQMTEYLPKDVREGDSVIEFLGYNSGGFRDDFTFGGDYILYRPDLIPEKKHTLGRRIIPSVLLVGIVYSYSTQIDKGRVLTNEYYQKIFSINETVSSYWKVSYDSNENTIRYLYQLQMKGGTSDGYKNDVNCLFEKQ